MNQHVSMVEQLHCVMHLIELIDVVLNVGAYAIAIYMFVFDLIMMVMVMVMMVLWLVVYLPNHDLVADKMLEICGTFWLTDTIDIPPSSSSLSSSTVSTSTTAPSSSSSSSWPTILIDNSLLGSDSDIDDN
jgi:hypothetical protein